ncbi:malignant fibrous histiocytoma-amplified sequence 1 homolog [Ptychodera flava]|uniref:malignant fibrous histiocytoma-amplified sequence 1 homolog n=1 Tax=Ptychodera flava TaxID=63121 RepID=UPI003969FAC2
MAENTDDNENFENVEHSCSHTSSIGETRPFSLNLSHRSLQNLQPSLNSYDISHVNLSGNRFCGFPSTLCDFNASCLTEINISSNKLPNISAEIAKFVNLRTFIADFNALNEFPAKLCELQRLTKLTLSHNVISHVPKEIGRLKSLKIFDISHNAFSEALPREICDLPSLEDFRAQSCKLSSLPEEFDQLKNLKVLIIGCNSRLGFSETIESLTSLEILCLNSNGMSTIRKKDSKKTIHKKYKFLLAEGSFKRLENLRLLNIAKNDVESIPTISDLEYLEQLDVTGNKELTLPDSIGGMAKLTDLRTDIENLPKSLAGSRVTIKKDPLNIPIKATNVDTSWRTDLLLDSSKRTPNYSMDRTPHGFAVIFNFENFGSEDKTRRGAKKDVEYVKDVFSNNLNYKVDVHCDLKYEDFMSKLEHYRDYDHKDHDSFVCFIMSHGNENGVCTSDHKNVKMEDVRDMFVGSKCPSLERKPKMFFIQACRGDIEHPTQYRKDASRPNMESESHRALRMK